MPGVRDSNIRSGDLHEGFGLELIRPFAFVAPVPRPEDIGFDAVATLLHEEGRRLYAEESFLVQVKSSSVRRLDYAHAPLSWLKALQLPLFILSVNLARATLELYTLAHATRRPNFRDRKRVSLFLDSRTFRLEGDQMEVWLGPPILCWTPADAATAKFRSQAYHVLKAWLTCENESIALRSIGMTKPMEEWKTNEIPCQSSIEVTLQDRGELPEVLKKLKPIIRRLMAPAFDLNEETNDLAIGLLLVFQYMRRQGVDPDPRNLLRCMVEHRLLQENQRS